MTRERSSRVCIVHDCHTRSHLFQLHLAPDEQSIGVVCFRHAVELGYPEVWSASLTADAVVGYVVVDGPSGKGWRLVNEWGRSRGDDTVELYPPGEVTP